MLRRPKPLKIEVVVPKEEEEEEEVFRSHDKHKRPGMELLTLISTGWEV
jgi:hypothetical protein